MNHTDGELARMVARDLQLHLEAAELTPSVFAIELWIDEGYAASDGAPRYGVSIGSDTDVWRPRDVSDEQWYRWPSSGRWNSGHWSHMVEEFLTPETEEALKPLRELIRQENDAPMDDDSVGICGPSYPCEHATANVRRWVEIGVNALLSSPMLSSLQATSDVLVYADSPDLTCDQRAMAMLRTVSPDRFHAAFPAWRRLAAAARAARDGDAQPAEELASLLAACGMHPQDVTAWSDQSLVMHIANSR